MPRKTNPPTIPTPTPSTPTTPTTTKATTKVPPTPTPTPPSINAATKPTKPTKPAPTVPTSSTSSTPGPVDPAGSARSVAGPATHAGSITPATDPAVPLGSTRATTSAAGEARTGWEMWPDIKQFEIYGVDLNTTVGSEKNNGFDDDHEANATRPCIIVQNDEGNATAGNDLTVIVPLTDTAAYKPGLLVQVFVPARELGDTKDGVAEIGHIRSIDRIRIKDGPRSWYLSEDTKEEILRKMAANLGITKPKPKPKK